MNIDLNNGKSIPALGLGTFRAQDREVYDGVLKALEVGYRHIDTAAIYANEEEVGRAIADSPVARDQIFVTTKVWNTVHTAKDAATAIDQSLRRLGLDYVDLLLVHWPGSYQRNAEVYSAMEAAHDQGKALSLGISNFSIHYIDALLKTARIVPTVNQVECHVHLQNTRLQEYMAPLGIHLEAYAPFKSHHIADILEDETLVAIGKAHDKSVPQVIIRWMLQRGIVAIPKSINPERIEANFRVFDFELSQDEMLAIRKLNKAQRVFPEPDNVDFGFVEF